MTKADGKRPTVFGRPYELSEADAAAYWELKETIKLHPNTLHLFEEIFSDENTDYSQSVRYVIASEFCYLHAVLNWALANFDNDRDLGLAITYHLLNPEKIASLLQNKHLTLKCVKTILEGEYSENLMANDLLLAGLPDETFTTDFVSYLVTTQRLYVTSAALMGRVRTLHNIDAEIPDEWVVRMLS